MGSFVCRYGSGSLRVYNDSMTRLLATTLGGGVYWFAVHPTGEYFYVTIDSVLYKIALQEDGNGDPVVIAQEYESVGAQKPIVIDINDYLWTIDNTPSNSIRKWANDLSSRADYTIKDGVVGNKITDAKLCLSSNNIYIIGGYTDETPYSTKIAKLGIDNLAGTPTWEINLIYELAGKEFRVASAAVDEDDNLYIYGTYWDGAAIAKIDPDGNVLWGFPYVPIYSGDGAGDVFNINYNDTTESLYIGAYSNTGDHHVKQISVTDGSTIGRTKAIANPTCCGVYNNILFVGTYKNPTTHYLYTFDISDDWESSENEINSEIFFGNYFYSNGDPTGFYRDKFANPPVAAFSGTPRTGNAPLTVTFTDSSTGSPTSWAWDFGDSEASTDQNPEHTYDSAGVYTVALTATNGAGSDTETKIDYIDVHDADVESLLDELAMRLEDAEQRVYPEAVKLKALHRGQLELTKLIDDSLIPELQTIHSSLDCSSGEIALSSLTYNILKDKEGLIRVKVTIGANTYWAVEIELKNLDLLENEYFLDDDEVYFYVQNSKIKIVAQDLTGATADVFYVKIPREFTVYQSPDLPAQYDNMILEMAENYCWAIEGRYDRAKAAKDIALREIAFLNKKRDEQQQLINIGVTFDF